jgi:hypothetical protein
MVPAFGPFGVNREGVLYVGDKGAIMGGFNGQRPAVYPESIAKRYPSPPQQERRERNPADDPIDQWLKAAKGGPASAANFEAQRAVTETILLGNLALRAKGEKLAWDTAQQRVTNVTAANQFVDPPYRGDWAR